MVQTSRFKPKKVESSETDGADSLRSPPASLVQNWTGLTFSQSQSVDFGQRFD